MTISERIKEIRENSGDNQIEFARRLNLSKQTVSNYETGARQPGLDIILKIAEIFNVSTDYLLCRSPYKTKEHELLNSKANRSEKLIDALIEYSKNASNTEKNLLCKMLKMDEFEGFLITLNSYINKRKYGNFYSVADINDGIEERDLRGWEELAKLESEIAASRGVKPELEGILNKYKNGVLLDIEKIEEKTGKPILKHYIGELFDDLLEKLIKMEG